MTPEECHRESMRHACKPHLGSQQDQGGEAQVGVRGVEVGRGHWPLLCVGVEGCNKGQRDTDHSQGVQRSVHELALRPAHSMAEIKHSLGVRCGLHPALRGSGSFHRTWICLHTTQSFMLFQSQRHGMQAAQPRCHRKSAWGACCSLRHSICLAMAKLKMTKGLRAEFGGQGGSVGQQSFTHEEGKGKCHEERVPVEELPGVIGEGVDLRVAHTVARWRPF